MTENKDGVISSPNIRVDSDVHEVPEPFQFAVRSFWTVSWESVRHEAVVVSEPTMDIVFENAWSRIVGVHERAFRRTLFDSGSLLGIKLVPGAFRALFDVDASTLKNGQTPLHLYAPGYETPTTQTALSFLDEHLSSPDKQTRQAIDVAKFVSDSPTSPTVEEIARRFTISERTLQRLVKAYIGCSLKWLINRHRIRDAMLRLESGADLAEAALAAGYYDQSHFNRDFRATTGHTPREFIAMRTTRQF